MESPVCWLRTPAGFDPSASVCTGSPLYISPAWSRGTETSDVTKTPPALLTGTRVPADLQTWTVQLQY